MWQRQRLRTWVKPGDRKLLQSSSFEQDGSRNLKTIAEAITTAGKRYGSGRRWYWKNIITGSKTVGVGATTFKSAPVDLQLSLMKKLESRVLICKRFQCVKADLQLLQQAAMERWDRDYLVEVCGDERFAVGPVNMKLDEYFLYSD
ncbi:hypothetical protein Tco_0433058 [Tanacetum coccineum]